MSYINFSAISLSSNQMLHVLGLETDDKESPEPMDNEEEMPATDPQPHNECFTRDQTLFLIDLMRSKLEEDGSELPKTLRELNARVKAGKGSKKAMWKEMAVKLSDHFKVFFDPDRVARKWGTLEEAYKKIKDNNRTTGKGALCFQFYEEMEQLLGGHHDIEFPVVGTSDGLEIRRPDALLTDRQQPSASPSSGSASLSSGPSPCRPRRPEDNSLLEFLRDSEAASQRRHEEMLSHMKTSQQSFEAMMKSYLEKN